MRLTDARVRMIPGRKQSTARRSSSPSRFVLIRVLGSVILAVSAGLVVLEVAGTPALASSTVAVSGTMDLYGVACPSATYCEAVGWNSSDEGVIVPITSGTPGSAVVVTGTEFLDGIACPSATTCEAVGQNSSGEGVIVPITSGTPGSAQVVSDTIGLTGVACPSATTCEAVSNGAIVPITNGTPGSAQVVSEALDGVACPSATTCEAGGRLPRFPRLRA
jgi:hypothetical protein